MNSEKYQKLLSISGVSVKTSHNHVWAYEKICAKNEDNTYPIGIDFTKVSHDNPEPRKLLDQSEIDLNFI